MNDKETSRLEAFSDGVFAVAITLLILNVSLPEFSLNHLPDDQHLWECWATNGPRLRHEKSYPALSG